MSEVIHYGRHDPACEERGSHVRTELIEYATCVACLRAAVTEKNALLLGAERLSSERYAAGAARLEALMAIATVIGMPGKVATAVDVARALEGRTP